MFYTNLLFAGHSFGTTAMFSNKWEQKHKVPDAYRNNAKSAERQKFSFPKESVENVDL